MSTFEKALKSIDGMCDFIEQEWGHKTMADMRNEAAKNFNGTAFNAIRIKGRERALMVVCITGEHELNKVRHLYASSPAANPLDWNVVTIAEAIMRSFNPGHIAVECEWDSSSNLSALMLIAADPFSSTKLAEAFCLP